MQAHAHPTVSTLAAARPHSETLTAEALHLGMRAVDGVEAVCSREAV
jgi:hypothetical protein